jgi:hypothetical protein
MTTLNCHNLNFDIKIYDWHMDLVFNPEPGAKWATFDRAGEVHGFCNALTHLINVAKPHYVEIDKGSLMHVSLEEAMTSLKNDNVGYKMGDVLKQMVEAGTIKRDKEIDLTATYRLGWDGFNLMAYELPFTEFVKGEPKWVGQNRNAIFLVRNMTRFYMAQVRGMNIRLNFSEDNKKLLDLKREQFELYDACEFEELARRISEDTANKAVSNAVNFYQRVAERVAADGGEFETRLGNWEVRDDKDMVLDPKSLVGRTIRYVAGTTVLSRTYTVTDETLPAILTALKNKALRVSVMPLPVGLNVLEPVC